MAKIYFSKYMHDDYSVSENVEVTLEIFPEDLAERIADARPWYEVELRYEYDTETSTLTCLGVVDSITEISD